VSKQIELIEVGFLQLLVLVVLCIW